MESAVIEGHMHSVLAHERPDEQTPYLSRNLAHGRGSHNVGKARCARVALPTGYRLDEKGNQSRL